MLVQSSTSKQAIETGNGFNESPSQQGGDGGGHSRLPKGGGVGAQKAAVDVGAATPHGGGVEDRTVSLSDLMQRSQAETLLDKTDSVSKPMQAPSQADLLKHTPSATAPSNAPSLSELMKQTPSATAPSSAPSLSELMKQTPSATAPSSAPSLSELMKQAPSATAPSSGRSLSELMKQTPSATAPSSAPSLSELMKQTPSATAPSSAPSLSELMKQTPLATAPSSAPSLSELMKQTPSATAPSSAPSLSELMKQTPSATAPSSAPSLSELMKQTPLATAPSSAPSLSELMKQTPLATAPSSAPSLSELMKQHEATKHESAKPHQVLPGGTEAGSSLLLSVKGHQRNTASSAAAIEDDEPLTLADLMKQLDTNEKLENVSAPSPHTGHYSYESGSDLLLVTPSHYDHYPMGDVTMGAFPYASMSHASGWSSSDHGTPSSVTSSQQYGCSQGFPTSSALSHDSHMLLSRGGRVEHVKDFAPKDMSLNMVLHSVAKAISVTGKEETDPTVSGSTSVVAIVPQAEASPGGIVVSKRCYSRYVNYGLVEAAILKSFVRDWTGRKVQRFSFSTPSPDDVILANRKGFTQ